jgi:hypothetical protein
MKNKKLINRRKHFNVGNLVSIIRHRHGWEDGRIKGRVSNVDFRKGGAANYVVIDENGIEYYVRATKDLNLIK